MKILANDGIAVEAKEKLTNAGFEVIETKVAQNQLENYLNENSIDAIVVKKTQVRQELIENCPSLKLIAKAGVKMDNIDVEYAVDNGVHVINTPTASSTAVAELVFAHLFGMVRFLHASNREMPLEGDTRFKELNKAYSQGIELRGKTLGIIGLGKTGKEVAKIAFGLGMNVIASDTNVDEETITLDFFNGQKVAFPLNTIPLEELLKSADFISLHVSEQEDYLITTSEFDKMKQGVGIINTSVSGIINEVDLIKAVDNGKVLFAGLDVFETEPTPAVQLLMHNNLSLSPNIGSETIEAEQRISNELAMQIIKLLK